MAKRTTLTAKAVAIGYDSLEAFFVDNITLTFQDMAKKLGTNYITVINHYNKFKRKYISEEAEKNLIKTLKK